MFINTSQGIDDLAALDVAAVTLVLQGKFDARLKELREAKADLDSREGVATTVKQAQAMMTAAETRKSDIAAFEVNVNAREQAAIAAAKNAADREAIANTLLKQIDEQNVAITKENTRQAAKQTQLENGFVILTDEKAKWALALAAEKAAIEAEKKAFNDKLASLKA